jgi:hypothetical protein
MCGIAIAIRTKTNSLQEQEAQVNTPLGQAVRALIRGNKCSMIARSWRKTKNHTFEMKESITVEVSRITVSGIHRLTLMA